MTAPDAASSPDLTALLPRHAYRYPARLVDRIVAYEPGRRLVAIKQVTVNEEFFQGHFPGLPLMPAVLQIESLTQAASALVLEHYGLPTARVALRGITGGKFRRGVVPGDQLRLELALHRTRARLAIVQAAAYVGSDVVAEATLLLAVDSGPATVHPTAIVHAGARIGRGSTVGPYCVIGPDVTIGERCRLGASVVVDGITSIGDETEVFINSCTFLFEVGKKYLVYAYRDGVDLFVNKCSRTQLLDSADEDINVFDRLVPKAQSFSRIGFGEIVSGKAKSDVALGAVSP